MGVKEGTLNHLAKRGQRCGTRLKKDGEEFQGTIAH